MPERWRNFGRALLALALGALAGFVLNSLNIPLASPTILRPSMKAAVGVMMSASIGPDILARLGTWAVPLAGLLVANLIGAIIACQLLQRVARLDASTAFLAAMPGGLTEMSLIAIALGADVAFVATHQLVRVVAVIFFAPLALEKLGIVSAKP